MPKLTPEELEKRKAEMTERANKRTFKRLTLELSEETVQKLEILKDELGFGSIVDVLRMAVQVLMYLEKEKKQGYDIILRKAEEDSLEKVNQ